MTTPISVEDSPEAATAAALALISGSRTDPDEDAPPAAPEPPDCSVTLPGGYLDLMSATLATEATVRELTGEDEEAISGVRGSFQKFLDVILAKGVDTIGDLKATPVILDSLLSGDRDALLIGISRVTFGDEIVYNAKCEECQTEQEAVVSLTRDIKIDVLEDPISGRSFDLTLSSGKVVKVDLPDGSAAKALAASKDTNSGRLNTILLANTVQSIDGFPVATEGQVKALGVRDRREIIKEISDRNPGPRFREVSRPCETCGADMPLPVSLVDLFQF